MTPEEAFEIILSTIKHQRRHVHYDRTVNYASMMERLVTGEGLEKELVRVTHRENARDWLLRLKFFFPVVPAACAKCRVSFQKVGRTQGYKGSIKYDGNGSEAKLKYLSKAVDEFYGDENLDDYLADRYLDMNLMDPNSFIMVGFDTFDFKKEKAKPYPIEVSSREAINLGRTNNRVDWLIAEFEHQYQTSKGDMMPGKRYVMWYTDIFQLTEVEFNSEHVEINEKAVPNMPPPEYVRIDKRSFKVEYIKPFSASQRLIAEFPGIQVGHVRDPKTAGRTFLSPLHPGINRMKETLKVGSELSIVMAMASIPQIYEYLPPCPGGGKRADGTLITCVKGKDPSTGETCPKCDGKGKSIPSSVLDVMVFDLPARATNEDLIDLSRLKHFSAPDTAILEFALKYRQQLEQNIILDVFTVTSFDGSASVAETATAVLVDEDAENNAVYPFAKKRATVWVKLVRLCAFFVDAIDGLQAQHPVPDNLQLASVDRLLDGLQRAKAAGASPTVADTIEEDIVAKQLRDKPDELIKYRVRKKYRPYRSMDSEMRRALIIGGQGGKYERILYINEDAIYQSLEEKNPKFYSLLESEQRKLINAEVEAISKRLEEEASRAAGNANLDEEDKEEDSTPADQ